MREDVRVCRTTEGEATSLRGGASEGDRYEGQVVVIWGSALAQDAYATLLGRRMRAMQDERRERESKPCREGFPIRGLCPKGGFGRAARERATRHR